MVFGNNKGMAWQYRGYVIHSQKITGFQEHAFPDLRIAKWTRHRELEIRNYEG
jgi:hypothetical protein